MKQIAMIGLILALSGCGGYHQAKREVGNAARAPHAGAVAVATPAPVKPRASGPINSACLASDRTARSRETCGCIQAVADDTLSRSQQRQAVGFYSDPHRAQEIRQSDGARDRAFWTAYRAYGERAERICS